MKRVVSITVVILLALVQLSLTVPDFLPSVPNFLLIYLGLSLLFIPLGEVLVLAVISGIILDFFSGLPDGVMLLSMSVGVLTSYYLAQTVFSEKYSNFIAIFYVAASTIIFSALVLAATYILSLFGITEPIQINGIIVQKVVVDTIVNVLLLYPVYWVYQIQIKMERRFKLKNESI